MSDLTNKRFCAGLTLLGVILMSLATFLLASKWDFSVIREVATLLLLVWLSTGSNIARWIVGTLSLAVVLIGIVGTIWLLSQRAGFENLESSQQLAFGVFAVAVVIHGLVAWLLLFRRRASNHNIMAEQAGAPNPTPADCAADPLTKP